MKSDWRRRDKSIRLRVWRCHCVMKVKQSAPCCFVYEKVLMRAIDACCRQLGPRSRGTYSASKFERRGLTVICPPLFRRALRGTVFTRSTSSAECSPNIGLGPRSWPRHPTGMQLPI